MIYNVNKKILFSLILVAFLALLQFRFEMTPIGSCVWTLGVQLVMLFWKVMELLRRGSSLEEVSLGEQDLLPNWRLCDQWPQSSATTSSPHDGLSLFEASVKINPLVALVRCFATAMSEVVRVQVSIVRTFVLEPRIFLK